MMQLRSTTHVTYVQHPISKTLCTCSMCHRFTHTHTCMHAPHTGIHTHYKNTVYSISWLFQKEAFSGQFKDFSTEEREDVERNYPGQSKPNKKYKNHRRGSACKRGGDEVSSFLLNMHRYLRQMKKQQEWGDAVSQVLKMNYAAVFLNQKYLQQTGRRLLHWSCLEKTGEHCRDFVWAVRCTMEIMCWICMRFWVAQTTAAMTKLKVIWNDKNIAVSSKIRLMHSLVMSIFFHACEMWT